MKSRHHRFCDTANSLVGGSPDDWVGYGFSGMGLLPWTMQMGIILSSAPIGMAFPPMRSRDMGEWREWIHPRWFVALGGAVNSTNSLVGTSSNDQIGSGGVTKLSNGNYVILSPQWDSVTIPGLRGRRRSCDMGECRSWRGWGAQQPQFPRGSHAGDAVGSGATFFGGSGCHAWSYPSGQRKLRVVSPELGFGHGHQRWGCDLGQCATGISGVVDSSNSLVGTTDFDAVGRYGVVALTNGAAKGNYVCGQLGLGL